LDLEIATKIQIVKKVSNVAKETMVKNFPGSLDLKSLKEKMAKIQIKMEITATTQTGIKN
jgi:hypothetical protein